MGPALGADAIWYLPAQGKPTLAAEKAAGGSGTRLSAAWGLAPFGFSGGNAPTVAVKLECSLSGDGEVTVRDVEPSGYMPKKFHDVMFVHH